MSVSPYALLRASKPKPPEVFTTQYDLYCLSQAPDTASVAAVPQEIPSTSISSASSVPYANAPAKKTHYIADIHARHTNAMRRTSQSPVPL